MSKEHYHIHKLTGKIQTPKLLRKGNQASEFTFLAFEEDMETLGFPKKLQEGWQDKAVGVFKELLDNNKALKTYMDICVRCGACTDKCQFFLGSGDINNTPVGRAELMRKVYRYYFTPFSSKGEPFSEHVLKQWMSYFYQCSECRRCSYFCPYGIDTAEITMAAREIMDSIGVGEKYATNTITQVYRTGNNIGIDANALKNTIAEFEEDLKDETGKDIKIPIDEEGAEVLLVPPSADFFAIRILSQCLVMRRYFTKQVLVIHYHLMHLRLQTLVCL
ncbi:4Fe-4S dicluster domain-containing protein [Desulfurella multipotens]|uniref:4Fe-4S dicluster domain-containing protein n=1 Tax=Desulfurella multipotens TaxID=79269 RepID=A0A1G6HQK6_9BACT|nr:(Fe-S)-binding protein [Desulfurella multipotens]SDB96145.1 4Fe-4S dicluster domain-containing protein [Desulfurella multipotens]